MLVTSHELPSVLEELRAQTKLAVDCETTSLRPYQGGEIISIHISDAKRQYCVLVPRVDLHLDYRDYALPRNDILKLRGIFEDATKTFYFFNAKFDLHFLSNYGLDFRGRIHCGKATARLIYNDHLSYNLQNCAARIGLKKDDTVERYLKEHDLYTWESIPGKKVRRKNWHYDQVPLDILLPYGNTDAAITFKLCEWQQKEIERMSDETPSGRPSIKTAYENERNLQRTVLRLEQHGLAIDRGYCQRAIKFDQARSDLAQSNFESSTGVGFVDSNKLFATVFASDKKRWGRTKKGNPSFGTEYLRGFEQPAAAHVIEYRDAKSRQNFFNGFLYWADSRSVIHPNLDPAGTVSGRFSSSQPNFQNLDGHGKGVSEFKVRSAIVPRAGFNLVEIDYSQVEYRVMADYAGEMGLIEGVKSGLDVHEATAQMMGVDRKQAKTLNFMLLYGGGAAKLADALGVSFEAATDLKNQYFSDLPNVRKFIKGVTAMAQSRGYVFNWLGRKLQFPDPNTAYRAPNHLIQGSCADIIKVAMNRIDRLLLTKHSRMILTVHDSILFEVHEQEMSVIPELKEIMCRAYPHKHLPLDATIAVSESNYGDLIDEKNS